MKSLTGTLALLRLVLRRDRIKLPVWVLSISGLVAVGTPALKDVYSATQDLIVYASTTATSTVARILGGPVDGPNLGSVLMVEYFLFSAVLAAFMSTLLVVRHTRQNEETGRSELIGSLVVGRHAALTAALMVAVGANLILTLLVGLIISGNGLPQEGAWAMAAGIGGSGIVFAAIAAIAVQMTENARSANGLCAIAIGAFYLVRGVGDALGTVAADGLSVASSWLSWLSPLGWGQQVHPFGDTQLWPLGLFAVFLVAFAAIAFRLATWRDIGLGLRATRPGPAKASPKLLSTLGLAWRMQRGVLLGWAAGIAVLGVTLGATSVEFRDLFTENEQFSEIIAQIGGGGSNLTDLYFSGMLAFTGILMAGYTLQALQRLRSEETAGLAELVLATNVNRAKWMMSHIGLVVVGLALLVLLAGISTSVSYVLVANESWSEVIRLSAATFVQAPPILVLAGFAVAVFGLIPRIAVALTWTAFAFCFLIVQLGSALNLPQWAINISPFAHTPAAPAPSIPIMPLVVLAGVAVVLAVVGLVSFRRRDVKTS